MAKITVTSQTRIADLKPLMQDGNAQLRATQDKNGVVTLYATKSNKVDNGKLMNQDRQQKIANGADVFRTIVENDIRSGLADAGWQGDALERETNSLLADLLGPVNFNVKCQVSKTGNKAVLADSIRNVGAELKLDGFEKTTQSQTEAFGHNMVADIMTAQDFVSNPANHY